MAVTMGRTTWLLLRVVEVSETEVVVSPRLVEVSPGVVVDSFVTVVEVDEAEDG
jgi:hypothetical protein